MTVTGSRRYDSAAESYFYWPPGRRGRGSVVLTRSTPRRRCRAGRAEPSPGGTAGRRRLLTRARPSPRARAAARPGPRARVDPAGPSPTPSPPSPPPRLRQCCAISPHRHSQMLLPAQMATPQPLSPPTGLPTQTQVNTLSHAPPPTPPSPRTPPAIPNGDRDQRWLRSRPPSFPIRPCSALDPPAEGLRHASRRGGSHDH